ncbi:hypothetical protein [Paenibacillus ihuae]|uniref:hypothetical protein n=1 Tax=Paenibacillus ihuae TaxID=1232431 RepID=UPI001651DF4E|nr:hypothetical protein [Paenibacillus ihuae]
MLSNNTVHLLFSGQSGESKQLVEFDGAEFYTEREFTLEPVSGKQTVTFLFLSGDSEEIRE